MTTLTDFSAAYQARVRQHKRASYLAAHRLYVQLVERARGPVAASKAAEVAMRAYRREEAR